jgi:serine/threonine protein kinase
MLLVAGTLLDSYEIITPLGAGGMGEVYRARDTLLKRDVAIKVLPEYWSRDPDRLRRFEQEAQATAALNHPNIVSIFHIGQYNGSPYIVTELLQGETLRDRLRRGPMRLRETRDFAVEMARGLAAAHDARVVHRDLKPENLFLTKDGHVKILDFGLAKLSQAQAASSDATTAPIQHQTEPGHVVGTVGYMAPEQVRGGAADARSDIFAFGVIL